MKRFAAVLVVLAVAGLTHAQQPEVTFDPSVDEGAILLTEQDFERIATQKGFNKKCLRLTDKGRGIFNALAAMDTNNRQSATTGFSIEVCTPANWISKQLVDAKKEYRVLTWADFSEADRDSSILRVIAYPDTGQYLEGEDVAHVVLRHPDKKKRETMIVQPLSLELFARELSNLMGAEQEYVGLVATFSIEELQTIRDKKGEFLVTVAGEGVGEKNYKVKKKHLDDLGWKKP